MTTSDTHTETKPRGRGRPRVGPARRATVTVRLRPALLQQMIETGETQQHSLSQEIEFRCQLFEDLAVAAKDGPAVVVFRGDTMVDRLRSVLQHEIAGLDVIVIDRASPAPARPEASARTVIVTARTVAIDTTGQGTGLGSLSEVLPGGSYANPVRIESSASVPANSAEPSARAARGDQTGPRRRKSADPGSASTR
jgi:hypothetical protein